MSDPLTWSFPLPRLFGINIRIHILFPVFALGMILRVAFLKDPPPPAPAWPSNLWIEVCILLAMAFVAVLLHELGHCFGARLVDGDAPEIMLWPLGGLAPLEVPHTPRANFIASAAGPVVNLLLCIACALLLGAYSFRPTLNPWSADANPVALRLYKWSDGLTYGSSDLNPGEPTKYSLKNDPARELKRGDVEEKPPPKEPTKEVPKEKQYVLKGDGTLVETEGKATLERWQVLVAMFFWVNWILFLMNLMPAFPLDGGRLLQAILWWRSDFRQGTMTTIMVGFFFMVVIAIYSLAIESVLAFMLALFIYLICRQQWYILETGGEEPMFGYDFSQGYTSLEQEQPPGPRPKRPNMFQRWLQRRAARRLQREQEEREAEERRLDALLEKVKEEGMHSLTEEERRFLTRVSSRYKNRH
jgi:Zn-dependent protease